MFLRVWHTDTHTHTQNEWKLSISRWLRFLWQDRSVKWLIWHEENLKVIIGFNLWRHSGHKKILNIIWFFLPWLPPIIEHLQHTEHSRTLQLLYQSIILMENRSKPKTDIIFSYHMQSQLLLWMEFKAELS